MLKAFIVEDEAKAVDLLRTYIEQIDFLELVGELRNPVAAFNQLEINPVDVLFLDINMPLLSGLDLYKSLKQPPQVIFTTAYPEYAVQGFDLEATDYLVKPISFPRFLRACQRLRKQHGKSQVPQTPVHSGHQDLVYVKSGAVMHKICWQDVLYLEKDENYVIYHTANSRILSRQTLTDLEEVFPSYICRIHKSFAVSLLHASRIERETLSINKVELPVGRTYRNSLMERLQAF